ncbi:MAG: spermidine synthase [Alicyclobacillus sp.]|nr:spermidine synthase [Alicyclobacillus sp.]
MTTQTLFDQPGGQHPRVQVIQRDGIIYLRFGPAGGWQGAYDPQRPERIIFPYQRAFSALVAALPPLPSFLSIGVGTGTSLRTVSTYHPGCRMVGVELDRTVVDLAIRYFSAPNHEQADYYVGDGVQYLKQIPSAFDLIFVDAYLSNRVYTPCLAPDFAALLARSLTKDGVAACNVIATYPFTGQAKGFIQAARSEFPSTLALPVGLPFGEQNILVVLSRNTEIERRWRQELSRHSRMALWQRWIWPLRVRRLDGAGRDLYN